MNFLLAAQLAFNALTLWLGDRKGIWPIKTDNMLVVMIRLEMICTRFRVAVVTIVTSIINLAILMAIF